MDCQNRLLHLSRSKAKKFKKEFSSFISDYKKIEFNDDYNTENHEFYFSEGILVKKKHTKQLMLAIKYTINQYNDFFTCIASNKKIIISKKNVDKIIFN